MYSFISCSPLVLQAWNREAPACQRINYVLLSWQGWHEYFSNYPQNWSQKTKAIEETTTHRGHIWRWENNSFLYFGVGKRERHTDQTNFNWSQFRPVSGSSTLLAWRRLCSYSSGQQCWPPHQILMKSAFLWDSLQCDHSTFWIMRTRNQLPNHAPFSKERNHSWVLSLKAVGGTPCLLNSILGIYMCNMSCYFWGDFVIMQWKSSMKFNEEFNSSQYKDW